MANNKILITSLIVLILVVGSIFIYSYINEKNLPNDVKELKKLVEGKTKEEKVEIICRFENQVFIDQCPEEGDCLCERHCGSGDNCEEETCLNKEEYKERLMSECKITEIDELDCGKYPLLCLFGIDGFRGGDINYMGSDGYYIGRCDLRGDRCIYMSRDKFGEYYYL